jgi:hypothetical protein
VREAFLELAGGGPTARIEFAAFLQPDLCETNHYPAQQAQGKGRLGVTDPALIFTQRHVQGVMQAALDDPVASFEFEKAQRIQLWEGEAADEIDDFGGLFTLASDPTPQSRYGLNSGKAHLLRVGILAVQDPDFVSPPVVLPRHGVGGRGGRRGKNAAR